MLAENSSNSSPDVTLKDMLKQKSGSLPKLKITPDDSTAQNEHVSFCSFNKSLTFAFLPSFFALHFLATHFYKNGFSSFYETLKLASI